ncbi:hypothetical protein BTW00_05440 [Psychrobacter sp. C 20.9]|uniref:hypothetical protein n=1 Tax=Psychrobacter sp. C 20.9 TaxID=1926477 RepID=UPI0009471588|nr:hypothetical protein [Psychrobacter sp. C 20.9]OLF36646.1 hypothetical protein BTW00_05440 [Psychrobacter sp. C 20.9]
MSEEIEKPLNWIRDKAKDYARAKATRVYLEQFRKSKKAILIQEAPQGTGQAKESYAYSHAEYIEILDALRVAVQEEEELRYMIKAAELKFEQWRTEQATKRAEHSRYGN